jgi:hypothetical protein
VNALVWRLHRHQAYIAGAALAALGALLLITGITMTRDYHAFLASCAAARSCGHASQLFAGDGAVTSLVNATMAVPALFGMFWGAPLLAREFEDGTHNLAWTQGVTRIRWLNRTVLWPMLAAAGWGAAMAALVSWWRGPQNAVAAPVRLATFTFDIQGIVPVAYAVFAVALGIAAGALLRRVLPTMAATFTVFTGLRFLIAEYARPHYLTPVSRSYPPFSDNSAPHGSLVLSNATLGPDGHNYTAGLGVSHGASGPTAKCTGHDYIIVSAGGAGCAPLCHAEPGPSAVVMARWRSPRSRKPRSRRPCTPGAGTHRCHRW